ncbi:4-oxalocrotonate tautomerase family protein [Gryllotalpicola reticulitermitis]|uniref:4-oxalocrotonate tautomerase family protein n=1 Tax=Gryllotalpicola reticulitermitis TaxID=1184153 RepID=A0ABV8Q478_9MICO
MPMIDVYAQSGTFPSTHRLAQRLAATLMEIEGVPDIPMFRSNTGAFVHELPASAISNVDGGSAHVRVQVLTNAGALDRGKQLAVVARFTDIIAAEAGDESARERTWVLLTEAAPGGWGLWGHAHTNEELVDAARKEIASLQG